MKINMSPKPVCLLLLLASLSSNLKADNTDPNTAQQPWQQAQATEVWSPVPPMVGADAQRPPSDALVLFDGKTLNQWQSAQGGAAPWALQEGALVVVPQTGDIKTKQRFCDVQLHLEWRAPSQITDATGKPLEGQGRSNSGIFLQEQYEVQILDSYHNATYANGQAGAIYKQAIPLVNASRPPGAWQSYDIVFSAPHFDSKQQLTAPAYITVLHNGVLVQNHVAIQGATTWIGQPSYKAHDCAPLRLQEHGAPVSFRNIWIRKL